MSKLGGETKMDPAERWVDEEKGVREKIPQTESERSMYGIEQWCPGWGGAGCGGGGGRRAATPPTAAPSPPPHSGADPCLPGAVRSCLCHPQLVAVSVILVWSSTY